MIIKTKSLKICTIILILEMFLYVEFDFMICVQDKQSSCKVLYFNIIAIEKRKDNALFISVRFYKVIGNDEFIAKKREYLY